MTTKATATEPESRARGRNYDRWISQGRCGHTAVTAPLPAQLHDLQQRLPSLICYVLLWVGFDSSYLWDTAFLNTFCIEHHLSLYTGKREHKV